MGFTSNTEMNADKSADVKPEVNDELKAITLKVNGTTHELQLDPNTPLLYVLTDDLGLYGPKFGCGLGQCGACTVHVDGRPTFSCILPIAAVGDREVTTLEGLLEDGKPNKLQQAFIDEEAAQCGYCSSPPS